MPSSLSRRQIVWAAVAVLVVVFLVRLLLVATAVSSGAVLTHSPVPLP